MKTRKLYLKLAVLFALLTALAILLAVLAKPAGLVLIAIIGVAAICIGLLLASISAAISPSPHQTMSDDLMTGLISLILR